MITKPILYLLLSIVLFKRNCSAINVSIVNQLDASGACPGGNTVSVFIGYNQQVIQPGGSIQVSGNFDSFPGLGIQVNNWYWASVALEIQKGPPQNPDNSGAQFTVDSACKLNQSPPWYGKGIETYKIASVSASWTSSGCTIKIAPNGYTNAVTPGCCAPPIFGSGACPLGTWGKTNSGQSWPPQ